MVETTDEYRCHSCPNRTFKQLSVLFNHFDEQGQFLFFFVVFHLISHINNCLKQKDHFDDDSSVGFLCWKKGCNQYFTSFNHLQRHFREIHWTNDIDTFENRSDIKFSSKYREHLICLGEELASHYLENLSNIKQNQQIQCDLCLKEFSSLSTLKIHYEDIHSIVLSSRAIHHWLFLLHHTHNDEHIKRQRTKINDQQLNILRSHFNLNHSPTDQQILLLGEQTHLSTKVIKHWFRNTLFKERQKNKDSPYNFSNPPLQSNQIDLDQYQKSGIIIKKNSDYSDNDEMTSNDSEDEIKKSVNKTSSTIQVRRANRTRFTDEQLHLLQEAFESNPYPKDEHLELLSDKLKLNSRVIIVWFQNARQKARKSYENNSPLSNENLQQQQQDKDEGYTCKNCSKLFQRFGELMKHAKQCSTSKIIPSYPTNEFTIPSLFNAAALFAAYHPGAAAAMAAFSSQLLQNNSTSVCCCFKLSIRIFLLVKIFSGNSLSSDSSDDGRTSIDSNEKSFKRNRTTILPEQHDYLMNQYALDSNPSRKILEQIAQQVQLKKRVVQVWFQNTRARERKTTLLKRKEDLFQIDFEDDNDELPLDLSKSSKHDEIEKEHETRRRFRTQMSPLQIKLMKAIFLDYRTPTM